MSFAQLDHHDSFLLSSSSLSSSSSPRHRQPHYYLGKPQHAFSFSTGSDSAANYHFAAAVVVVATFASVLAPFFIGRQGFDCSSSI